MNSARPHHRPRAVRGSFITCLALALPTTLAAAEGLEYPLSIAANPSGLIFLADRNLPGVWRLEGGKLSLYFKASKKFRTPLNAVRCVAFDKDGHLLAGDSATRDVYRFDESGTPKPLTRENDTVSYGRIGIPMDIAVGSEGDLFVSDLEIHRVVKVPGAGGEPKEFIEIPAPRGLFMDAQGNLWVISGRKLARVSPQGEKSLVVDNGVFEFPHTVVVGEDQTAFVCDGYAKAIWKVPAGGKPEKWVHGQPFVNPVGMAMQGEVLLVVDPRAKAVFQVSSDGKVTALPVQGDE